jgi:integral membrane protein
MLELLKTQLGRLRIIAFAEGVSFLMLLFISMPLKYIFGMPEANAVIGMIHGLLFVLYVLGVIQAKFMFDWSLKNMFLALLASIVPFGTFWADKKIFKGSEKNVV